MDNRPIVILTALDVEYRAIRERLDKPRVHRHPQGTRFEVGRTAPNGCRIVLAQVGKGNHAAAVLAERAAAEFNPIALLFAGVAGGLRGHIALGDVVVGTHIYAFHGGTSEDDAFRTRPRVWETKHGAEQIARHTERERVWTRDFGERDRLPKVHFGPIAAGEVVLNSAISDYARRLHDGYNDAFAIEMESAGVAQAAHLNENLPLVVVRGISDHADGTKEASDQGDWQARAMESATAYAIALANDLAADAAHDVQSTETENGRNTVTHGMTTRFIAKDNARVGVQAGAIHGDVRIGHEPERLQDLGTALTAFRTQLRRAQAAGQVDQDTYDAVDAELAVADEALAVGTPQAKSKLVLALKKVRGLIGDLGDLAVKASAILNLVQGRS